MNTFLFSVYLETSAAVEQENMRKSVLKVVETYSAFAENVTVQLIPLPDNLRGIEAHVHLEALTLKEQNKNLQIALHGALDLLKAPGDILQAQAKGDVEKVAFWIVNEAKR